MADDEINARHLKNFALDGVGRKILICQSKETMKIQWVWRVRRCFGKEAPGFPR
jgi:hypothetical protein